MSETDAEGRTVFRAAALASAVLSACYLAAMAGWSTLRPEQLVAVAAYNLCFVIGSGPRRLALAVLPVMLFIVAYDSMRLYPNHSHVSVDIEGLYRLEKQTFGVRHGGGVLTPNERLALLDVPALDLLAGLFYLNWISVPAAFGVWLFFSNKGLYLCYCWAFVLVNFIGFAIYYIHPAAPPWYVAKHGFDLMIGMPGDPARLSRFDSMIGAGVFSAIYSRNANVFAALPSLHCAYPVVAILYAAMARSWGWVVALTLFAVGVWFAAIYSGHHYVIDLVCGILCAVVGVSAFEAGFRRSGAMRRFIKSCETALRCHS